MAAASQEDIAKAREMDLLTYLKNYEPGELVKVANGTYCTREHDSLKISNGKWYWFSRQIGGTSALDYLIHVKGQSFLEAVGTVLGRSLAQPPVSYKQPDLAVKTLQLPAKSEHSYRVTQYLRGRGIHPAILDYCYKANILYEGFPYHNAVFVGHDEKGAPRYAALRGTFGTFKGEASGSDKQYSFRIPARQNSTTVHLFEAAIDLLSYATMEYRAGRDWRREHLLSLAGVFKTQNKGVVPAALQQFLNAHPEIQALHLHLDNDEIGRGATQCIIAALAQQYEIVDEPPRFGNDMNDTLLHQIQLRKKEVNAR